MVGPDCQATCLNLWPLPHRPLQPPSDQKVCGNDKKETQDKNGVVLFAHPINHKSYANDT